MIMNRKGYGVKQSGVISQHFLGGTGENQKKPQSEWLMPQSRLCYVVFTATHRIRNCHLSAKFIFFRNSQVSMYNTGRCVKYVSNSFL